MGRCLQYYSRAQLKEVVSTALVDCRCYYVSCERLFNPSLNNKPVVVLSNGDGITVALSPEAKALGVKRGTPFFEIKHLVNQGIIHAYSSNYTLYADISNRIQSVIEQIVPTIHPYSLDEVFLDISGFENVHELGVIITKEVYRQVGIPVGFGAGPNATVSKIAQYAAKTYKDKCKGVAVLDTKDKRQWLYERMPVEETWGVGRQLKKKLNSINIMTVADLARQDVSYIRKTYGSNLADTVLELNGHSKISIVEPSNPNKHQIISSHSFGSAIPSDQMFFPIAEHFIKACEKLRKQNKVSGVCVIFFRTDPYKKNLPQLSHGINIKLPMPSSNTSEWMKAARAAIETFFSGKQTFMIKKAGVIFNDLHFEDEAQSDLFSAKKTGNPDVLNVMDRINQRFGRSSLTLAPAINEQKAWQVRRDRLSPRYTTCWKELPKAY